jgi:hypothetical protein
MRDTITAVCGGGCKLSSSNFKWRHGILSLATPAASLTL